MKTLTEYGKSTPEGQGGPPTSLRLVNQPAPQALGSSSQQPSRKPWYLPRYSGETLRGETQHSASL